MPLAGIWRHTRRPLPGTVAPVNQPTQADAPSAGTGRGINASVLRRLRVERSWSQEELAIAAGVSLRTVQRLEAEARGSVRTLKCVAAALEVDMHNLERKPRTELAGARWGYGGVAVGSACAVIAVLAEWITNGNAAQAGISLGIIGAIAGVSCAVIGTLLDRRE